MQPDMCTVTITKKPDRTYFLEFKISHAGTLMEMNFLFLLNDFTFPRWLDKINGRPGMVQSQHGHNLVSAVWKEDRVVFENRDIDDVLMSKCDLCRSSVEDASRKAIINALTQDVLKVSLPSAPTTAHK